MMMMEKRSKRKFKFSQIKKEFEFHFNALNIYRVRNLALLYDFN